MPAGRHTDYTPELAEEICQRLVCGKDDRPESLRSICRDERMPHMSTLMKWLIKIPEFNEQYVRAREAQQELIQEEIVEISDDCTDDVAFLVTEDSDGDSAKPFIKHSAIARARLRIDTRKWLMGKMAPKKYGDKLHQEITGKDGAPLVPAAKLEITPDVVSAIRIALDSEI